jgi:LuxR family transcriptional regulator, maltose regulon positive regulatory protein
MLSAILATKLYIPPPPPKVVFRPRLIERLNEGLLVGHTPGVTLISAPAGFGKTTLISEWVAVCKRQVAWLSLDEGDSDPTRFLTYLVAALRTVAPEIGEGVLSALQSSQPPPIEVILTALLNEITALPGQYVLVLDDYHRIEAKPVDLALTFLLEHLPPQMHLVITTREDPQLPLARYRARGQLTELRATDLRFMPSEAAEFLNQVMGLTLTAADMAALEDRTEGWIAGLQLAALSMQGHQDIPGFIQAFAGDHQYIVDYLVEEVLQRQPEPVRSFLLQTAILDRLNGPLCDAVTGMEGGSARLAALQRGNFFLIPLDDRRYWYRYHNLFAEVLHMHLITEQPAQVPALHRRASEWYQQNGSATDAIRHALAGKDFDRAADLVEQTFQTMAQNRQEALLLGWFKALPEALIRNRPVLCNLYAGVLMQTGEIQGVEAWLLAAERGLNLTGDGCEWLEAPSVTRVVANKEEFRRLPGAVAVHRAGLALLLGNVAGTMEFARRALDLAPEDDFLRRGGAAALLGLAYWTNGNLEAAQQMYTEGMAWLRRAGNISDDIGCAIALADISIAQGRLRKTSRIFEQALQLAAEHGTPTMRGTADMLVGMSELSREQNDLHAALQYLQRSKEQGEHTGLPQNRYRWRAALAHVREAQGDLDGALDLLDEAEHLYVSDFSPNVRPIAAMKTRVWVAQSRLDEALGWAREHNLTAQDDLSYLCEYEHITFARILLAQYKSNRADRFLLEAMGLLERLLKAAQEGERAGSAIEILVLQALAHQAQGNIPAALLPLHRALTLAAPEGYVRKFLDEGPPMAQLLLEAASRGMMPVETGKLLEAFKPEHPPALAVLGQGTSSQASPGESSLIDRRREPSPASQPLIEPLSQRELEILRLFNTELSGPEIADQLVIALSTVRTHTKSIFSKLNVNNRRAAVKRAEELDLI